MKHCTNCGLQIAQDVTTCPRCGSSVPDRSTAPFASSTPTTGTTPATPVLPASEMVVPQQDFTEPSHSAPLTQSSPENTVSGQPQPNATPSPQLQQSPPAPAQPPLYLTPPPPPNDRTLYAGQTMWQQPPQYGASYPPPQYGASYPPPQMPYPPYQTPPPPQRRSRGGLSPALIATSIVLALLLVFGGIGLIYYSTVARPAQLHAQATGTAQAIATGNANATAVANTHATGTAVTNANATATVQVQATVQAQATTTALQNLYTQSTKGTPSMTSSLAAQDNNNWEVNDAVGGGGCGFNAGSYHVTIQSKNFYFTCYAQGTNFSNFAYQVQMTINEGDAGGLVFRGNSNRDLAQFYLFSINQNGAYRLDVSKDATHGMALAEDTSSAIKSGLGQTNLVTIIARGSTIYFYINKQYVGSVSDSTYGSGTIGVFADDSTSNTDVSFNSAQVWAL